MKRLLYLWKELMITFWFLPVLIIGLAVLLSIGLVSLDNLIVISEDSWFSFFLVNSADSARSILTTISGAMIGVAGTVFSITLVALTLASSQFGPRLIKNFMYVRLNQAVLGSYISTYLYALLVLNSIKDNNGEAFIPSISILFAIFATIANIILLIIFIHNIAISIQADKIISDISEYISKQVETLFPEKLGEGKDDKDFDLLHTISGFRREYSIKSTKGGYLHYIDNDRLIEVITEHDGFFELNHRPGGYIVKGQEIGVLYSNENIREDGIEEILNQFVIGKTKTPQQDLEYSIHQMVEIASRALSPGVNDPFTAIACIDNLTSTMSYLAQAKFPSKYRFDEDDHLRLVVDTVDFEGVLDAAFNQIRQFSGGSTAVVIRLIEALITIFEFTEREAHKKALIKHAKMVLSVGEENITEKNDIKDLNRRAEKIFSME